ncbi:MAG: radical SAM protein [Lachnospiraceae bacterium]|nr:radical SAM protein [Lachnospiraceae bacterium]
MRASAYDLGSLNFKYNYNTLTYPTTVYLKITDNCNCDCDFCSQERNLNYMTEKNFCALMNDLNQISVSNVVYTGGEPLMHPKIKNMVEIANQYNFSQILVTNGLLIKENEKILPYFNTVGISLHGDEKTHDEIMHYKGAYKKVMQAIECLTKHNNYIVVNYTMCSHNNSLEQLLHIAEICRANEASLNVARLNYVGKGKKVNPTDLKNMLNYVYMLKNDGYNIRISNCVAPCLVDEKYRYLTHGCSAGQTIAAIETNGDVKICPSSSIVLGNIFSDSFKRVWRCKELKKFKSGQWLPAKCKVCLDFVKCKAGCKAENDGKFWEHMCDQEVKRKWNDMWEEISQKRIVLTLERISKNGKDYYMHSNPIIKCSNKIFDIISSIDGRMTGKEFIEKKRHIVDEEKLIELLVALYVDNIIEINEGGCNEVL